jgi:hypothetical protein
MGCTAGIGYLWDWQAVRLILNLGSCNGIRDTSSLILTGDVPLSASCPSTCTKWLPLLQSTEETDRRVKWMMWWQLKVEVHQLLQTLSWCLLHGKWTGGVAPEQMSHQSLCWLHGEIKGLSISICCFGCLCKSNKYDYNMFIVYILNTLYKNKPHPEIGLLNAGGGSSGQSHPWKGLKYHVWCP